MNFAYTVWLVFLAMQYSAMAQSQKPNILIIMADDMVRKEHNYIRTTTNII